MLNWAQRIGLGFSVFGVAGAGLYAGYGQLKKRDFGVICDAYSTAPASAMSDDPATVAFAIAAKIDGNTITKPARQAVNAAAMAESGQKYALIQAAAMDEGLTNWECPAMRDFLLKAATPAANDAANSVMTGPDKPDWKSWDDKPPVGHPDHTE